MNSKQKIGIYVALATILILIFLHSPWSGYETKFDKNYTGSSSDLPFSLWHTAGPLVHWLGYVDNFLASIALVTLLAAIWIAATKKPKA